MFMRTAALGVSLVALVAIGPARAKTIVVSPGAGTPFQDAINAASPGDTLRVSPGTYPEAIVIDKALRVLAQGCCSWVIDAGCAAGTAVNILADDVTFSGLTVQGGTFYEIDAEGRDRVKVLRSVMTETCGTAEYGVQVYQSTNSKVLLNETAGSSDAGGHIGGLGRSGNVRVHSHERRKSPP